jgi:hypothetical protein
MIFNCIVELKISDKKAHLELVGLNAHSRNCHPVCRIQNHQQLTNPISAYGSARHPAEQLEDALMLHSLLFSGYLTYLSRDCD